MSVIQAEDLTTGGVMDRAELSGFTTIGTLSPDGTRLYLGESSPDGSSAVTVRDATAGAAFRELASIVLNGSSPIPSLLTTTSIARSPEDPHRLIVLALDSVPPTPTFHVITIDTDRNHVGSDAAVALDAADPLATFVSGVVFTRECAVGDRTCYCTTDRECDDGDPCTIDRCDAAGCSYARPSCLDQGRCPLADASTDRSETIGTACAAAGRRVTRLAARARDAMSTLERDPARASRQLGRAIRLVQSAAAVAVRLKLAPGASRRLVDFFDDCADEVVARQIVRLRHLRALRGNLDACLRETGAP